MQNRTMRAVVSTRQPAALLDFCMTWRTFKEIDRDAEQSLNPLRHRPMYMRARPVLQTVQAMKHRVKCLWNETGNRIRPCGRILNHQAPTFPFTIGLKAIKGSRAVPVPSVLFKFGAGYSVGKADMAFGPCNAM